MSFDHDGGHGFLFSFVMYACHSLTRQTGNHLQHLSFPVTLSKRYNFVGIMQIASCKIM